MMNSIINKPDICLESKIHSKVVDNNRNKARNSTMVCRNNSLGSTFLKDEEKNTKCPL